MSQIKQKAINEVLEEIKDKSDKLDLKIKRIEENKVAKPGSDHHKFLVIKHKVYQGILKGLNKMKERQ